MLDAGTKEDLCSTSLSPGNCAPGHSKILVRPVVPPLHLGDVAVPPLSREAGIRPKEEFYTWCLGCVLEQPFWSEFINHLLLLVRLDTSSGESKVFSRGELKCLVQLLKRDFSSNQFVLCRVGTSSDQTGKLAACCPLPATRSWSSIEVAARLYSSLWLFFLFPNLKVPVSSSENFWYGCLFPQQFRTIKLCFMSYICRYVCSGLFYV